MRDLPLTLLRALAAVRAEGGVRPAARLLSVGHSAVSRSLRDLEGWLGTPVTKPRVRGAPLVLTAQGVALADAALRAMTDLQTASDQVRAAAGAQNVTISAPPSVAARWLLPRLDALQAACPGVEISITVDEVRMGVLDPAADLILRMGPRPRAALVVCDLGDDVAVPVMAVEAWHAAGRPEHPDALRNLTLLHDRDPRTAWARWRDAVGPSDLDVRRGPRLTSSDLVLGAAEAGHGVAMVRERLAQRALAAGRLVRACGAAAVPLPDEWWLAEGRDASIKGAAGRVRDWIIAEFHDDP